MQTHTHIHTHTHTNTHSTCFTEPQLIVSSPNGCLIDIIEYGIVIKVLILSVPAVAHIIVIHCPLVGSQLSCLPQLSQGLSTPSINIIKQGCHSSHACHGYHKAWASLASTPSDRVATALMLAMAILGLRHPQHQYHQAGLPELSCLSQLSNRVCQIMKNS